MPPPAPPQRPDQAPYHFHAYDYSSSAAWTLSPAQNGKQFYSLAQDLKGLRAYGRDNQIPGITLTAGPAIKYPPDDFEGRVLTLSLGKPGAPAAIITGGIHAREWIAPEMAYLLAEYLVRNYPTGTGKATKYQERIRELVDNRWIEITPMLNPCGVQYTIFKPGPAARLWRKNRRELPTRADAWMAELTANGAPNPPFRNVKKFTPGQPGSVAEVCQYEVPHYDAKQWSSPGVTQFAPHDLHHAFGVDLNRNFVTTAWGYDGMQGGSSDADPRQDTYFGPNRASEKETRFFAAQLRGVQNIRTAVDFHAYGQLILYPTEPYDRGAVNPDYVALGKVLRGLTDKEYVLGPGRDDLEYDATGTLSDHVAETYGARAFVIELDPALAKNASEKEREEGFMPGEDKIQAMFERNIRPALALIDAAGGGRDAAALMRDYRKWKVVGRGNQLPG
jgi:hypothetical protein